MERSVFRGKMSGEHSILGREEMMIREENKKLKHGNFLENLQRQQKKLEFKKQLIMEREKQYDSKISQLKSEQQMVMRYKAEAKNKQMQDKEHKLSALMKLNHKSVLDKE